MYYHGQSVKCFIDGEEITDAKISINNDGEGFICQNKAAGTIADNLFGYRYSWKISRDFTNSCLSNLKSTRTSGENLIKLDIIN